MRIKHNECMELARLITSTDSYSPNFWHLLKTAIRRQADAHFYHSEWHLRVGSTRLVVNPTAYPRNVLCRPDSCRSLIVEHWFTAGPARGTTGRVEMWRGGLRYSLSVAAPFVWRCLNSSTITPFPHPAHQTGHADFPHPAFGQNITPSSTAHYASSKIDVRDVASRRGTGQENPCTHSV